jgi:hypothetical protein
VPRLILAAVSPDNTPHGSNWTFAFPMLLFIVIGTVLYLRLSRPHRRVPPKPVSMPAAAHVPAADVARSAAVAGGLSTAPGGGTTESHLEPGGAHLTAGGHVDPADTGPAAAEEAVSDPATSDPPGIPDGPEAGE